MSGITTNANGTEVYTLDLPVGVGIGVNADGAEIYRLNLPTGPGGMITTDADGREVYLPGIAGAVTPTLDNILLDDDGNYLTDDDGNYLEAA